MIKVLNKAIMTRSRLRNKYLEEKNTDSKITNNKQRNLMRRATSAPLP